MDDKLVEVRLMTPSDHNFVYERPDGSAYKVMFRKGKEPTTEEIINYQGPLFAKHPDLNLPTPPPLDKYGQANPRSSNTNS